MNAQVLFAFKFVSTTSFVTTVVCGLLLLSMVLVRSWSG